MYVTAPVETEDLDYGKAWVWEYDNTKDNINISIL